MVCAGETFINVIVLAEERAFNVDRFYITGNSIDVALVARKLRIFLFMHTSRLSAKATKTKSK